MKASEIWDIVDVCQICLPLHELGFTGCKSGYFVKNLNPPKKVVEGFISFPCLPLKAYTFFPFNY